ncbi:MAG: DUF4350 domain-containing protein [Defluviitaleaceae bacterium]|nr:DUF4350 domain-containing protein [Defluviitaleaceae bacterium]
MNFYDAMNEVLQKRRYDFLAGRRGESDGFFRRAADWFFDFFSGAFDFSGGANFFAVIFLVFIFFVAAGAFALLRADSENILCTSPRKKFFMRKNIFARILFVVIFLVVAAIFFDSNSGESAPFSHSAADERGAGLFFDTLRKMNYNVRVGRHAISARTPHQNIFILVQPRKIDVSEAAQILEWVKNGGRLIFLCENFPQSFFSQNENKIDAGSFILYQIGAGEIVFGRADELTNARLMQNHAYGQMLQTTLDRWRGERMFGNIFFCEFYQGVSDSKNLFEVAGNLPPIIKILFVQIIFAVTILFLHYSKKFGN